MISQPRLRIIAGPNGSGKSTILPILKPNWVGFYLNPDSLQKEIQTSGLLDLTNLPIALTLEQIRGFFLNSRFLAQKNLLLGADQLSIDKTFVTFGSLTVNDKFPYYISVLCDLIRTKLLGQNISFTFETVMSSHDKVEQLQYAKNLGWKNYLYYLCTESPEINIERVRSRVLDSGHDVPTDKIKSRYYRSLDNLIEAISHSDRAYIFDNSSAEAKLILEFTNSPENYSITFHSTEIPQWVAIHILNKLNL